MGQTGFNIGRAYSPNVSRARIGISGKFSAELIMRITRVTRFPASVASRDVRRVPVNKSASLTVHVPLPSSCGWRGSKVGLLFLKRDIWIP